MRSRSLSASELHQIAGRSLLAHVLDAVHAAGVTETAVVIGPGAVVKGTLKFQREVKLYVSDRATIGPVEGATVNKFSGEHP